MFGPATSITVYHRVCCMERCGSSLPTPFLSTLHTSTWPKGAVKGLETDDFTRRGTRGTITTLSLAPRALRPTDGQMGSSLAVWHRCLDFPPVRDLLEMVCHGVSENGNGPYHGIAWYTPKYSFYWRTCWLGAMDSRVPNSQTKPVGPRMLSTTPCETSVTIVLSFQHIPRFDASPLLAEEALQWERA